MNKCLGTIECSMLQIVVLLWPWTMGSGGVNGKQKPCLLGLGVSFKFTSDPEGLWPSTLLKIKLTEGV